MKIRNGEDVSILITRLQNIDDRYTVRWLANKIGAWPQTIYAWMNTGKSISHRYQDALEKVAEEHNIK